MQMRSPDCLALLLVMAVSCLSGLRAEAVTGADQPTASDLWRHENLFAWEAAPYDTIKRTPEERALMFQRLGIRHYAYLSSTDPWDSMDDVNTSQQDVDAEIEAMQRHHIGILAWYFWINSDNPATVPKFEETLASFRRHGIHPQIWVTNSFAYRPRTPEEWAKELPAGVSMPKSGEEYLRMSAPEQTAIKEAMERVEQRNMPTGLHEQKARVAREAARIKAIVTVAAPYGCSVEIYNHRGWFGMIDNELAILTELEKLGVTDVGMVYNFSHSRDDKHDDSRDFLQNWKKIQAHVVAINVSGLTGLEDVVYPSQGDHELPMMHIIQDSGWRGPVGLLVLWKPDDTEKVLENSRAGLDWISAELRRPGAGGPRPHLTAR